MVDSQPPCITAANYALGLRDNMGLTDRRLTGRDVLAKTFQAKTKRGYDPVEVDAYLELVAAQIDMLHGDVTRAGEEAAPAADPEPATPGAAEVQLSNARSDLAAVSAERDALSAQLAEATQSLEAANAENEQLRVQVTAVAPPPPAPIVAVSEEVAAVAADADDRATEESYELILRMARRSAEETIAEAHLRADEIVSAANTTASEISKESDRKAFEAANRVQAELNTVTEDVDRRKAELRLIEGQTAQQKAELRTLAGHILHLADSPTSAAGGQPLEGAELVDLRTATSSTTV